MLMIPDKVWWTLAYTREWFVQSYPDNYEYILQAEEHADVVLIVTRIKSRHYGRPRFLVWQYVTTRV